MTVNTIKPTANIRVAFFLNDFPVLSQTFILNQITGIMDLGADVEIFAFRENKLDTIHEIIHQYHLLEKVQYIKDTPIGRKARLVHFFRALFSVNMLEHFKSVFKGLNIKRFGRSVKSLQLPCDILQFRRKMSFDIIHCQFGVIATRVLNLIEVGVFHGSLVTSFRGYDATNYARQFPGVYNRLFDRGDYFLPVSESLKSSIIELGCPVDKISVLHSGIMTEEFSYTQKQCPKSGPVKVLSVARLVEKKGIDISLNAMAKVQSAGVDITYSIIGDGPLREILIEIAESLGIAEKVFFLGWKNHTEVLAELNKSHILVAPSITAENGDQEGIPNVIKEAMAVGLPVIGTLHGGIPELIKDGESGFLVPEKDSDALSERIVYLRHHPEIWPSLGLKARKIIEQEFDSQRINEKLLAIYKSMLT